MFTNSSYYLHCILNKPSKNLSRSFFSILREEKGSQSYFWRINWLSFGGPQTTGRRHWEECLEGESQQEDSDQVRQCHVHHGNPRLHLSIPRPKVRCGQSSSDSGVCSASSNTGSGSGYSNANYRLEIDNILWNSPFPPHQQIREGLKNWCSVN